MAVPSTVNRTVFSLAGSQTTRFATVPAPFVDQQPLGVRCYSLVNAFDRWVTAWVDDITFRSVIPGGFASATITLRIPRHMATIANPDPLGFSQLADLFRRIQVVDLRTMEIAWEGRIEDPARQVEPDVWQIGALGSMVAATDVQRPVFYVDSSLDRWLPGELIDDEGGFGSSTPTTWSNDKDDNALTLTTTFNENGFLDELLNRYSWRWDSHGFDQPVARFTTTHDGGSSNGSAPQSSMQMIVGIAGIPKIDVTAFSGSEQTKTNVIGTDFANANARYIIFGTTMAAGSGVYSPTSSEVLQTKLRNPKVVGLRTDRTGAHLTTAASYPADYVTVAQVVEDVVGRYLVAGWYEAGLNTPWPGSVRSQDVVIDDSDTTQIQHLVYPEGATAADILNDLCTKVQTNAYWAIWESKWQASAADQDWPAASGFRFEWTVWPNNAGYFISSQDGFEGQPTGDDLVNFVSVRYPDVNDGNAYHVFTAWHTDEMDPELYFGGFTRAVTIGKDDPTTDSAALALGNIYLTDHKKAPNTGSLTVRRPVLFYDPGGETAAGACRMLDPWMIRPGKLVRITDLPPRVLERDLSSGTTLPDPGLNGTIFRVVATEYNSSDNSCRMELDQVSRWQVPTQISSAAGGSKAIRIQ